MTPPEGGLTAAVRRLERSTRGLADGEDLVQEALARALAAGVSPDAVPWLRTVTRRLAVDRARRAREVPSGGSVELEALAVEADPGPEEEVVSSEARAAVRRALGGLPPRYRQALVVYAVSGRASEVARHLGLGPQAAWTLLSRARARLRRELDRIGFMPALAGSRLGRWWACAACGAVAVGVAISVGISHPQHPEAAGRARPPGEAIVRAVAVASPLPVTRAAARGGEEGPGAKRPIGASRQPAVAPPPPTPRLYGGAEACVPGGRRLVVDVQYLDDERPGLEPVVDVVPPQARQVLVSEGC